MPLIKYIPRQNPHVAKLAAALQNEETNRKFLIMYAAQIKGMRGKQFLMPRHRRACVTMRSHMERMQDLTQVQTALRALLLKSIDVLV